MVKSVVGVKIIISTYTIDTNNLDFCGMTSDLLIRHLQAIF